MKNHLPNEIDPALKALPKRVQASLGGGVSSLG
jgi:hypothetical protein